MNAIGLDKKKTEKLAGKLNNLLADYMMFYQNTRGLHWNIKGEKFFELHLKFEELYTNLLLKVDEVAERILTLGATPLQRLIRVTAPLFSASLVAAFLLCILRCIHASRYID